MEIKLSNLNNEETKELLPDNLILLGYRGSIAHGTYVPQDDPTSIDDKDIMGIYISPIDYYLGIRKNKLSVKEKFIKEWDSVSYELTKYISLLIKSNPNVLSLMWLDKNYYIYIHPIGQELIDNREIFISKEAYHSFNGYAWGQFNRMTKYKFDGYMGEKRKKLVEKYGYDCKSVSHLIRLLEMGIEYLMEGSLRVMRTNNAKLISIKKGEWTLEEVKKEAQRLFDLSQQAYIKSSLPSTVNLEEINSLSVHLLKKYFNFN